MNSSESCKSPLSGSDVSISDWSPQGSTSLNGWQSVIKQIRVSTAQKIARLQQKFTFRIDKLEQQLKLMRKHCITLELEREKLKTAQEESKMLCRLAHDRIVSLNEKTSSLQKQLDSTAELLEAEQFRTKDLNWKLEQLTFAEVLETEVPLKCICSEIRHVCGNIADPILLQTVRAACNRTNRIQNNESQLNASVNLFES